MRGKRYLLEPSLSKIHKSVDDTTLMSTDLVTFSSTAIENIKRYIDAKLNDLPNKISPVCVTKQEEQEANCIENYSVKDLQLLIYKKMETLENFRLQDEIFHKTIRNKNKSQYIKFYHEICEVADAENTEEIETSEEHEDL